MPQNNKRDGNKISLFENNSDNPKAPEFSAIIEIGGKKYRAGLWHMRSKAGNDYWFGGVEEDDGKYSGKGGSGRGSSRGNRSRQEPQEEKSSVNNVPDLEDLDDDLPF